MIKIVLSDWFVVLGTMKVTMMALVSLFQGALSILVRLALDPMTIATSHEIHIRS